MMKIVIDMDCTLYPFPILEALAYLYPGRATFGYEDMYRWTWYDKHYSKDEFYEAVDLAHEWQMRATPYKDAVHWVRRMGKHVPIIVASHRGNVHMLKTLRWLRKHGITHDGLYCHTGDKESLFVEGDLVIDDCVAIIRTAQKKGCTVGTLIHPWNKDMWEMHTMGSYTIHSGNNWAELGSKVYNIVKGERRK